MIQIILLTRNWSKGPLHFTVQSTSTNSESSAITYWCLGFISTLCYMNSNVAGMGSAIRKRGQDIKWQIKCLGLSIRLLGTLRIHITYSVLTSRNYNIQQPLFPGIRTFTVCVCVCVCVCIQSQLEPDVLYRSICKWSLAAQYHWNTLQTTCSPGWQTPLNTNQNHRLLKPYML